MVTTVDKPQEVQQRINECGTLTLEREDLNRAIEPDSCFYIQNESVVRGKNLDLKNVQPPDLVIESDYTNSWVNKY
jgi:Uma2 family endonuclease